MKYVMLMVTMFGLCSGSYSFAQPGLQAGWNSSLYTWKDINAVAYSSTLQQGFSAGGLYRFEVDRLAVQPTVMYTQKGAALSRYGATYQPGDLHYRNRLSYLQFSLPVLWRLPFHYSLYSFDIGAGPYMAILLAAAGKRVDRAGEVYMSRQPIGNREGDAFRRMDVGATAYVGVRFHHLNISATWDQGITNISPREGQLVRNGSLALNCGVFLYNDHTGKRYQVRR